MKERLSEPKFWENGYKKRKGPGICQIRKYRAHYELDRIFKTLLRPDKSKKLLELGAGGSIWLPYFAMEFGYEVYGIDYSKKGCEIAERNLNLAQVKGHILCDDFFYAKEQWKDFFDVIISFGVVEHFNDPIEIIYLIKDLLRGNGIAITLVPNTTGLMFQLQKLIDKDVYNTHKVFSLEELSNYHKEAGMQIILERYLQFMDLGLLNYQNIFKGRFHKWVARCITGINLPILYIQKFLRLFPQCKRWCSFMLVAARNEKSKRGEVSKCMSL